MPKVVANQEFKARISAITNNEFVVLGDYINAKTPLVFKHISNNCNYHEFTRTPDTFYKSPTCPCCNKEIQIKNMSKTHEEFTQEIFELVGNEYSVIGKYTNNREHIIMKHNCDSCDYLEYPVTPSHFLNGRRCPKCAELNKNIHLRKTHEQFVQEVFNLENANYIVVGKYINAKTKISMKHGECGNVYEVKPNNFLSGFRCPFCNESKGEEQIRNWLVNNNLHYEYQKGFSNLLGLGGCKLLYDFFLPSYNLLIEFDGEYHYKPIKKHKEEPIKLAEKRLEKQRTHDQLKNEYCISNNINILRIPYWDFDNIEGILVNELNKYNISDKEMVSS